MEAQQLEPCFLGRSLPLTHYPAPSYLPQKVLQSHLPKMALRSKRHLQTVSEFRSLPALPAKGRPQYTDVFAYTPLITNNTLIKVADSGANVKDFGARDG